MVLSQVLAADTSSDSGSPVPSTARCSLDPRLARSTGFAPTWSPPCRAQADRVHAHPRPVQQPRGAQLVQQQLLEPLEHPRGRPLGEASPAGGHAAAAELAHRQQRPRGGGAGHEDDRGHAGPVGHGAGCAAAGVGWRRRQQGLEALPELVGQQAVGQGGHEPGSSHHPANPRFRNVLLCVTGFFLTTYMAGTRRPSFWLSLVASVHSTFAATFILSLAAMCFFVFAEGEKDRSKRPEMATRPWMATIQQACGWVILGAVALVIVGGLLNVTIWELTPLYLGEV